MLPVLVLNFSYEVLNITNFKRAVKLLVVGKAEVVEHYPSYLHSPSTTMSAPSIIRLLYQVTVPKVRLSPTKRNIFIRDYYTCQYCGVSSVKMTIDHVTPKSAGGTTRWENLVCACYACNNRKQNRTVQEANMALLKQPLKPKYLPWVKMRYGNYPKEWEKYLYFA